MLLLADPTAYTALAQPHTPHNAPPVHPLGKGGETGVKVRLDDGEHPIWVTIKANTMLRKMNLKIRFILHAPIRYRTAAERIVVIKENGLKALASKPLLLIRRGKESETLGSGKIPSQNFERDVCDL